MMYDKTGMDLCLSFSSNCGLSITERKRKGGRQVEGRGKKACTFSHTKELKGSPCDGYIRHCCLKSNPQIHLPPFHLSFIYVLFVIFCFPIWWQLCTSNESSKTLNFIFLWFFSSFTVNFWKAFLKSSCLSDNFKFWRCEAGITATLHVACPVLNPIFIAFKVQ